MNHSQRYQDELSSRPVQAGAPIFYWHIEKRTKTGWKFIRDFSETKEYAKDFFIRLYNDGSHRLRKFGSYDTPQTKAERWAAEYMAAHRICTVAPAFRVCDACKFRQPEVDPLAGDWAEDMRDEHMNRRPEVGF